MTFVDELRQLTRDWLARDDLTIREGAEAVKCSYTTMRAWVRVGGRLPQRKTLNGIAFALRDVGIMREWLNENHGADDAAPCSMVSELRDLTWCWYQSGLSQSAIATAIGRNQRVVSSWIYGRTMLREDALNALAVELRAAGLMVKRLRVGPAPHHNPAALKAQAEKRRRRRISRARKAQGARGGRNRARGRGVRRKR